MSLAWSRSCCGTVNSSIRYWTARNENLQENNKVTFPKSTLLKATLAAAIAGGAVVATATTASASVACNRYGECWHVHDRLAYPDGLGIVFHDDAWANAHRDHWRWRHLRYDRGYYRNGAWITF
jgi:hypothetical protein